MAMDVSDWRSLGYVKTDDLWILDDRDKLGEMLTIKNCGSNKFPGNFVPEIPYQMMVRYTDSGDVVLDPAAGGGTTLDVANLLGRKCFAFDLNPQRSDILKANVMRRYYPKNKITIFHPPYHDIIKYSDDPEDLSRCKDVNQFIVKIKYAMTNLDVSLESGGHLVLVLGRIYENGQVWDLGNRVATWMQDTMKYKLKGIIAKNYGFSKRDIQLHRYRALKNGYWVFRYDSVYVFQKPKTLCSPVKE